MSTLKSQLRIAYAYTYAHAHARARSSNRILPISCFETLKKLKWLMVTSLNWLDLLIVEVQSKLTPLDSWAHILWPYPAHLCYKLGLSTFYILL